MPLVSFIIPAYNAKRWIGETLDSVMEQRLNDSETIVIDDGSTDGTADLVAEKYPWARLERGPNRGVSAARNIGTALASGDFIQYVDSDDLLPRGSVEARIDALKESGTDVAYSDWQRLVETKDNQFELSQLVVRKIESTHRQADIAIFTDFWCPPVALTYTREIVERVGSWNLRLPIIQDARFLLDVALLGGTFIHVNRIGGYYREYHGDSLSRRNSREFVFDVWTNALEIEQWWSEHGSINEDRRQALLKVYGGVTRASYANDPALFEKAFTALRRLDPHYVPSGPYHLSIATKLFGYRNAERLALIYREIKRKLHLTDIRTANREWV